MRRVRISFLGYGKTFRLSTDADYGVAGTAQMFGNAGREYMEKYNSQTRRPHYSILDR